MKNINGINLYSTKEVAEMLGASVTFVRAKMRKGLIASTKISRGNYVSESALADYLNGKTPN